jgi:cell division protein FtsN
MEIQETMNRDSQGSELELVLDHRKLILAFLVLICVCGGFFVIGFVEGKRQGFQEGSQASLETARPQIDQNANLAENNAGAADTVEEQKAPLPSREQLDWYKNVNNQGRAESDLSVPSPEPKAAPERIVVGPKASEARASVERTPRSVAQAGPASGYSVQVGAFRQRREAETKADMLKAKGYQCIIVSSQSGEIRIPCRSREHAVEAEEGRLYHVHQSEQLNIR